MKTLRSSCLFLALFSSTFALAGTSDLKPGSRDNDAQRKCQRLSSVSAQRGIRTLVIGFEGLASFSASGTRNAYSFMDELARDKNAEAPGGSMGGFVVNGLMMPAIAKFKGNFELLMFPYTGTDTAETCALEWMKVKGRRLIVAGHSYGGDAAVQLAEALEERSVMIDMVLTIDPRAIFPRSRSSIHSTRNARRWENYFQHGGGLPGQSMSNVLVNSRLRGGHTGMPRQPEVRSAFFAMLAR